MATCEKIVDTKYVKVSTDENGTANEIPTEFGYGYGYRHVQVLLMFFCVCVNYIVCAHLSATIIAMSDISKNSSNIFPIIRNNVTKLNQTYLNHIQNDEADATINKIYKSESNKNDTNKAVNVFKKNGTQDYKRDMYKKEIGMMFMDINESENYNETADVKNVESVWNVYRTYKWPKAYQEILCLMGLSLGEFIMSIPAGMLVQRWGGKIGLQIGLFVTGIVTFVTPWLVAWAEWKALAATRVVIGMSQAILYPGIYTLLARWVPVSERARLSTYVYTGAMVGTVVAFQICGFLSVSRFGWPSIFWVCGSLGVIMSIIIAIFGANSPQRHKFIKDEERNFILGQVCRGVEIRPRTPWKAILTSRPLWAIILAHVGTITFTVFNFMQIPSYLRYILKVDIQNSGLLASVPYAANTMTTLMFGQLSDYGINHRIVTRRQARMISNTVANVIPAICLTVLTFTSNTVLGVSLLVLSVAAGGGCHTGFMINYIDLAPNFSGTLSSLGTTIMHVFVSLLPVFISEVITDVSNPVQWRIVLLSIAAFGLVCNGVYMVFMSTDEQPWNKPQYEAAAKEDDFEKPKKRKI